MEIRKSYLVIGLLTLVVGLLLIYPFERMNSPHSELVFPILIGVAGVVITLNGLFHTKFLTRLLFLTFCIASSTLFFFLWEEATWGRGIFLFWCGIPAGAISGLLFLLINHSFFKNKSYNMKFNLLRCLILITIYVVVVLALML